MRAINLSNARSRNAQVALDVKCCRSAVAMVHPDGLELQNVRLLKFTPATTLENLLNSHGADLTDQIIHNDVEVDSEREGMYLFRTKKVFLDSGFKVARRVNRSRVFFTPDGIEKEVRPFRTTEANINVERPLRWTGKLVPKSKAVRMFAFSRTYQVCHINGLTFDFLYDIALELAKSDSLLLLGSGAKGMGSIVMSAGGTPYRAFLEGRVDGTDKYCLLLHLTNIELKSL